MVSHCDCSNENSLRRSWQTFKDGTKRGIDIAWKDEWFTRFNREPYYFAYAEILPEWDGTTRLLYVERNYMLNAVPLQVIKKPGKRP